MTVNYDKLRKENEIKYGTDIGRIGGMLLANRYDKRIHFIFELLQNAEDALRRRDGWKGSRAVDFHLSAKELRVSHFGQPFDEADVQGVCGIDESTKDITAIGRFGIGFKSVYAFTDCPEIHSGTEGFAIKSYVWPFASAARNRKPDETLIALPLRERDATPHK
jgi:HSP90 family molecular chaperone